MQCCTTAHTSRLVNFKFTFYLTWPQSFPEALSWLRACHFRSAAAGIYLCPEHDVFGKVHHLKVSTVNDCYHVFSGLGARLQAHAPVFYYHNCDGVHLRQPVVDGIGEQYIIQRQFLKPVRIMPDFDIFADGPTTMLAVLDQIQHFIIL